MKSRLLILIPLIIALIIAIAVNLSEIQAFGSNLKERIESRTVRSVVTELVESGKGLNEGELEATSALTLIALKEEEMLEVWGHDKDGEMTRIRSYPFTATSGELGPKLKEGDYQIPEGIYRIEYLNPNSSYHLSMKLNYPNSFDRKKGKEDDRKGLGFDIFIHGRSVTIGCIAIGDEAIEDLFVIVSQVGVSKVNVILAPRDFRKNLPSPEIPGIDWEEELYEEIRTEILPFEVPESEE
ncbi:MAG: L,D-transpeptidase family protein [Verrucomicrobiota bacterium]